MVHSLLSTAKCHVPLPPPPVPETFDWDTIPGWYAKIDKAQLDSNGVGQTDSTPRVHFPSNYLSDYGANNFPGSVYYELLHYKWFRGIQVDLFWGDIDNGDPNPANWNWTVYDNMFNTVEALGSKGLNGSNKKILLLISNTKTFSIADGTRILPSDLRTTGTAYSNSATGPLYIIDPNANPVAPHHVFIDMPRYDLLWGFDSNSNQPVTSGFGYHHRAADYRLGLSGTNRNGDPIYTLRDREYAFIAAVYNRYKTYACFAGFTSVEPTPFGSADVIDLSEYNFNHIIAGRVQRLKDIRAMCPTCLVIEAGTHDDAYQIRMTAAAGTAGADGCIVNNLGFTGPNFHRGQNLKGIHNARLNLDNEVCIAIQCQGQDMRSMSGNIPKYWVWNATPPNYGGASNGNPTTLVNAPPHLGPITDLQWAYDRAMYFKANLFIVQKIMTNAADTPWDWDTLVSEMNSTSITSTNPIGGLIKNDPAGGMAITRPNHLVYGD